MNTSNDILFCHLLNFVEHPLVEFLVVLFGRCFFIPCPVFSPHIQVTSIEMALDMVFCGLFCFLFTEATLLKFCGHCFPCALNKPNQFIWMSTIALWENVFHGDE